MDIPIPDDFWLSLTLDELARMQQIKPIDNTALFGVRPDNADDDFEAAVDEWRHNQNDSSIYGFDDYVSPPPREFSIFVRYKLEGRVPPMYYPLEEDNNG